MIAIVQLVLWLVGCACLVYGVYLFEPRAAWLTAGVLLLIEANTPSEKEVVIDDAD